ncbi:hypothetical protein BH23CHL7_BH23CHL7_18170 [soil metagenome]
MSLGIAFKGPEGIVLAADSRVTLTVQQGPPGSQQVMPAYFDNATKLLTFTSQPYIGAVTYGLGAIGTTEPRTAHSFLTEFETSIAGRPRMKVGELARHLSDFFLARFNGVMPSPWSGVDLVFLVGGYDEGEDYGRLYEIKIPGVPAPVEQQASTFGITWGGQTEATARLLNGFDGQLITVAQSALNLQPAQVTQLHDALRQNMGAKIPYQFLPLQDCVDLSIFLIRATAELQSWQVGIRGVGGAIDVATITRTDGLREIQRKQIVGEGGLSGRTVIRR